VIAEVVDRDGVPNGAMVDSRCPGRLLKVNLASPYHYVRHAGRSTTGSTITVFYTDARSQRDLHSDTTTVGRGGWFNVGLTDLAAFAKPGDSLRVLVHHQPPGPSTQQTMAEYGIALG
jgi:hypothetical protein